MANTKPIINQNELSAVTAKNAVKKTLNERQVDIKNL